MTFAGVNFFFNGELVALLLFLEMSESESLTLMNPGEEIWTEEEVIEFGLAGEEEFCDLETVETSIDLPSIPEVTESAELVYLDDVESALPEPDSSTKKLGRVSVFQL